MRIPITMCHGIRDDGDKPLTADHFSSLIGIAAELGFETIGYDQLAAWRAGEGTLPARPIMLDFDHPVKSMLYGVRPILDRHGFKANLFVQTKPMISEKKQASGEWLTWAELALLRDAGWGIGAHTHTHPNLSKLFTEDPSGAALQEELDTNDGLLAEHLGVRPVDFAYTGTSTSSVAMEMVKRRYRFGRLWIIGSEYQVDGATIRYGDLVGVPGPDEADGGPPAAARYITRETFAHMLPSMELQALIYEPAAFRAYLEGAVG